MGSVDINTISDPEIKRMFEESITVLRNSGATIDEENILQVLTQRVKEARKAAGEEVEEEPKAPATPGKKVVTVNDGDENLSTEGVEKAMAKGGAYWYEKPEDKRFMDHFFALRQKTSMVGNLIVTGPSGAGKTEGLKRAAEDAGLPFYKMDCATMTTDDKWIGHKEVITTRQGPETVFVMSEHLKWLEGKEVPPGVLCYDEINRVHPTRLNILIPILDGSQRVFVPDMGRYVDVHPQTIVVATANLGAAFGGTYQFDRALRERFTFTIERMFPPKGEEVKVLTTATGVDKDKAALMVDIAVQTRKKWEQGDLESPISTRTLKAAALLVASGMPIVDALNYTALPLYRSDGGSGSERATVKLIISGKAA